MAGLSPLSDISGALQSIGILQSNAPVEAMVTGQAAPPDWLTGKLAQVSLILLGLLLIGAGLFSFDKTREMIVTGAKAAAV